MEHEDMGCLSALRSMEGHLPQTACCTHRTQKDLPEDAAGNSSWDILSDLRVVW